MSLRTRVLRTLALRTLSLRNVPLRTNAFRAAASLQALSVDAKSLWSVRAGYCGGIAALLVVLGCESLQNATAEGDTRTISFHHTHTGENLTVTYKVNGRYDEAALEKINHELRDWREEKTIKMDPHVIDLLWEVHRETGSKEPIWVVCGYRSPETNSMLRRRSSGVAKASQHMLGKAVDFYIPGVPLDQLRAAGLRAQRGGVGFYPTSGSPFVHLDTGSVRHWPRMPEQQLAAVLAKGPLSSQSASDGGKVAVAQAGFKPPAFLAKLFGGGKDEEEDAETAAQPAPAKAAAPARPATKPDTRTAAAAPLPPTRPAKPGIQLASYKVASADAAPVPAPTIQPAFELASTTSRPIILAADDMSPATSRLSRPANVAQSDTSANDIINARGYWQGAPGTETTEAAGGAPASTAPASSPSVNAPRRAPAPRRAASASAEPATTASTTPWPINRGDSDPAPNALSYAAQPTPIAGARALPMGAGTGSAPGTGTARAAQEAVKAVEARRGEERPTFMPAAAAPKVKGATVVRVGDRFNDPWMRAMIVSPSAQSFMRTTVYGMQDFRTLSAYLLKPTTTVAMTFTDDPHLGMSSERFTGTAVAFTPTIAFGLPRTAAAQR